MLPEFYSCMLRREEQIKNIDEIPGKFSNMWSKLSKELNIWVKLIIGQNKNLLNHVYEIKKTIIFLHSDLHWIIFGEIRKK